LAGLKEANLVEATGTGRDQRLTLTAVGTLRLTAASEAVASIEERMLSGLSTQRRNALRKDLDDITHALAEPD